jgi:ADP-ribose pyrophosphatase YjhB (NUDIX family)
VCKRQHRKIVSDHQAMPRKLLFKYGSRLILHPWFRLTRGLSLGVRGLVRDENGRILLIRHSYVPGWLLPGGGVERGETAEAAVIRELREEAGVVAIGRPQLFGLYCNEAQFTGDHVALYTVDDFNLEPFAGTAEIVEARFFKADELPDATSGGTRRRIAEVMAGDAPASHW